MSGSRLGACQRRRKHAKDAKAQRQAEHHASFQERRAYFEGIVNEVAPWMTKSLESKGLMP